MVLFFRKIAEKVIKFFYRVKIYGKENVPEGGVMIVCNHFSLLDPVFLLSVYSDKNIKFLSKQEVSTVKGFGKVLVKAGAIPVDREKPSMESLLTCVKTLKKGHKLVLFPEGTRNKTGTDELQEIKAGAAIFALKAKTPILPVMILKKAHFLRKTQILVGKPFTLEEYYDKKLNAEVTNEINDKVKREMLAVQQELKEMTVKRKNKCKR